MLSYKIVAGNWKMNPVSLTEAEDLYLDTIDALGSTKEVSIIVCPPAPFLSVMQEIYSGKKIFLGAQDVFWERQGSYTGEYSALQLASVGVSHVIVGHSERRAQGESNKMINRKVQAATAEKLSVILCFGEQERDLHGKYLSTLRSQLCSALLGIGRSKLSNVIIAYEPVWAIGKSDEDAITPKDLHEMVIFVRKVLAEQYTKKLALSVPILYGGSVERDNAEELLREGEVDGFLVGHASLVPKEFVDIISTAVRVHQQKTAV